MPFFLYLRTGNRKEYAAIIGKRREKMKTRLYLDTRHHGAEAPLYLVIARKGQSGYIPLGISIPPAAWDAKERRIKQLPAKAYPLRDYAENFITRQVTKIKALLLDAEADGRLHGLTANGIRDYVIGQLHPDEHQPVGLIDYMRHFADLHTGKRTRELYYITVKRLEDFGAADVTLDAVTADWLRRFDAFMAATSPSPNARNIHLRNIRATLNAAIDEELTSNYPFRRFKLRNVETEKRSLTSAELRAFFAAPCPTPTVAEHRDVFRLVFLLIGINVTDLMHLRPSDYYGGRIHYTRAKTHKPYSIKVEPEAAAIIERRRGRDFLLDIADRYGEPKDYIKYLNINLKRVGERVENGTLIQPYKRITSYWARHSWATIAVNECDIPKDTVSAALGHEYGSKVTSVYINFDVRKIDEANKRVISAVCR